MPAFRAALQAAGKQLTAFVYEGTEHGFFNESRPVYDAGSAQLSFDRTRRFFREQLSPSKPSAVREADATQAPQLGSA